MRFSSSAILAALPALATAQESPFEQYQAQFQSILGQVGQYIPSPNTHDAAAAHEAKTGPKKLHTLTLDNWKPTLLEPIALEGKEKAEWWVLASGRNKTCFGRCGKVETAFNETAEKFATLPGAPYMAYLNCDDQPVLCNSWSTATSNLYIFEVADAPEINIYKKRLNMTTTTSDDLVKLHETNGKADLEALEGYFQPWNGKLAELGLAVPFGYVMWVFGVVPNWLFMLLISFGSRTMMGNRMGTQPGGPNRAAAPAAARFAPPGDARS